MRDNLSLELSETFIALERYEATSTLVRLLGNPSPEALTALGTLSSSIGESVVLASRHMTMESVQSRDKGAVGKIVEHIGQTMQKTLEQFHYNLQFLSFQGSRIRNLKHRVKDFDNRETYSISIPVSKYMRYGYDMSVPTSGKEYLAAFRDMVQQLSAMATVIKPLADDDVGAFIKNLWKLISGQIDQHMVDRTQALIGYAEQLVTKGKLRRHSSSNKYIETYVGDMILGGVQITATLPGEREVSTEDVRTAMDSLRNTTMYVYRKDKVRISTAADGRVRLTFTGAELKELYDLCEGLYDQIDGLLSLATKWSASMSNSPMSASLRERDTENYDYPNGALLRNFRVIAKYNSVIYDSVASTLNVGMGNIKKALSIIEDA